MSIAVRWSCPASLCLCWTNSCLQTTSQFGSLTRADWIVISIEDSLQNDAEVSIFVPSCPSSACSWSGCYRIFQWISITDFPSSLTAVLDGMQSWMSWDVVIWRLLFPSSSLFSFPLLSFKSTVKGKIEWLNDRVAISMCHSSFPYRDFFLCSIPKIIKTLLMCTD
jgi:hypothetical protein